MEVSIVVPVYNSSKILDELNKRILNVMKTCNLQDSFELILVNDSSSDDSWKKIKYLSGVYGYIKGINLSENFGQHNSLMAGFNYCNGNFIVTMDDDLQHPPEYVPEIVEQLKSYDVCYTNYINRKHLGWKKAVSNLNNIVSSFLLSKPLNIYMSSFRGLKKNIVKEIIKYKEPNVYIDGLIIKSTNKVKMIDVEHHERKTGKSNYDIKKLFILWSNLILNFSFFPIRISSIFGISLKFFALIIRKKNNKPQFKIIDKT